MNINCEDRLLRVNATQILLPCNVNSKSVVENTVVVQNRIVVCLRSFGAASSQGVLTLPNHNRNVWCFGLDGQKLWEIEEQTKFFPQEKFRMFLTIRFIDGRLISYNEIGFTYEVDTETGNIKLFPPDQSRPW